MLELGVAELLNPGQPELSFNTGLNTLFVEVPGLIATPGSIYIEASGAPDTVITKYQPLINSMVLTAHAGANIDIYNKTPFSMVTEGALAEDNKRTITDGEGNFLVMTPGNVFVNNIPLTANNASVTSEIRITQDNLGPLNKYGLNNLPIPLPKLNQDLYINGMSSMKRAISV